MNARCITLFVALVTVGQAVDGNQTQGQPSAKKTYKLGPDSLVQEGVPQGKLEGPLLFRSKVFDGTVRQYWVYVPAQYQADKPAALMVFQDGEGMKKDTSRWRAPTVFGKQSPRCRMSP